MNKIYEITEEGFNTLLEMKTIKQNGSDMLEGLYKTRDEYEVENGIAYIHIFGMLMRNASDFEKEMSITDYDDLEDELEMAMNDILVQQVVLKFDSPGGESIGSTEIVNIVENFPKPIFGVIKGICASAAYKIASACTGIYSTISSECGSIGSIIIIQNSKTAMNAMGVENNIFVNTQAIYKSVGQDFGDTTEEQKVYLQQKIESTSKKFQDIVIRNRPNTNPEVFNGAMFDAESALSLGLIDAILEY